MKGDQQSGPTVVGWMIDLIHSVQKCGIGWITIALSWEWDGESKVRPLCVCARAAVVVRGCLAVSVARVRHRCTSARVLPVSAASSWFAASRPTCLDAAAVARPITAATHHRLHHVRRLLGRLVVGAVLDSGVGRQQSVLAVDDDVIGQWWCWWWGRRSVHTSWQPDSDVVLMSPCRRQYSFIRHVIIAFLLTQRTQHRLLPLVNISVFFRISPFARCW